MPEFQLAVTWSVSAIIMVEADTYEEACEKAINDETLPDGEYVDSSFEVIGLCESMECNDA